jgi:integrase/recombinase XerC
VDNLREHLVAQGLSPRSVRHYLGGARRALTWFAEQGWDLSQASAVQVAAYVDTLPRTWATRNLARASLRHYWASVGRAEPPMRALRVPPKPRMVCRALDEGDARILAKSARFHGGREGLALALALYMGLRREEVATLRWDDFDAGWVTVIGKGDRARTLPVHRVVAELLAEHDHDGPYLFAGRFSPHVHPATVWEWVRRLSEAAGLAAVPTHVCRHTCLATANDRTGDLRSTQELAGHASSEQTSGYTRATTARLTALVDAIDYD